MGSEAWEYRWRGEGGSFPDTFYIYFLRYFFLTERLNCSDVSLQNSFSILFTLIKKSHSWNIQLTFYYIVFLILYYCIVILIVVVFLSQFHYLGRHISLFLYILSTCFNLTSPNNKTWTTKFSIIDLKLNKLKIRFAIAINKIVHISYINLTGYVTIYILHVITNDILMILLNFFLYVKPLKTE